MSISTRNIYQLTNSIGVLMGGGKTQQFTVATGKSIYETSVKCVHIECANNVYVKDIDVLTRLEITIAF